MSETSQTLFQRAQAVIPGGVNSPVRAFKAVGGVPRFFASAKGARLIDEDGREYIDFIGSWGPMILGHGHPAIVEAVQRQAAVAMSFGAPTRAEVELAELLCAIVPGLEQVRLVNSGTEACMSAVRLARAATGREFLIKFEGCYHGHADSFLSKAGSGMATLGEPTSPGVVRGAASATLNATFNRLESVEALLQAHPGQVAAIIVEPVVGNMGCVPPAPGFLEGLRALCDQHGALLIFDEVMTGFRLALGGAQELYGVRADLVTLGKVIGGGLPVGAYGGRRDVMRHVSPLGAMYQAGTLSGNPLATAAGLAQLRTLHAHPEIYAELDRSGARLVQAVQAHARARGYPVSFQRVGSMGTLFFTERPVASWEEAATCRTDLFARYFHELLRRGVYMPPAQFEAWFHSAAHDAAVMDAAAEAMKAALDAAFVD